MLVLGTALFYFYRPMRWQVFIMGFVITGLITWGIGRPANHIGASGIVYLLASFLFFKGIVSKQYQLTALSFAVVFVYGSLPCRRKGCVLYVFCAYICAVGIILVAQSMIPFGSLVDAFRMI